MFLQPTDLPHFRAQLHLPTTNQMSCSHQDQQQLASNVSQETAQNMSAAEIISI